MRRRCRSRDCAHALLPLVCIVECQAAASFDFYRQFLPGSSSSKPTTSSGHGRDNWRPQPGVRKATHATFYQAKWDAECRGDGPYGLRAWCNHTDATGCASRLAKGASKFTGKKEYTALTVGAYATLAENRSWTASGESLGELIERSLRQAWGPSPPRVDLMLRAGCGAAHELQALYPSLELFWPSFLGDVILVLDAGDEQFDDEFILPKNRFSTKLSYRTVYEEVPCTIHPRIFNQVSYMHFDTHSTADYLVTIDSDCALHSPVTPDLIFNREGKLMLPYSRFFQKNYWRDPVEFFTGKGTSRWHAMVTQPITFMGSTMVAYREWVRATLRRRRQQAEPPQGNERTCYVDEVSRMRGVLSKELWRRFCWMCQLGTFLNMTGTTLESYELVNLDDKNSSTIYQRLGSHLTWEPYHSYQYTMLRNTHEGLCRALGNATVPMCTGVGSWLVDAQTFRYSTLRWAFNPRAPARLADYVANFRLAEVESRGATATAAGAYGGLSNARHRGKGVMKFGSQ